jgi:hypothetical protein
MQLITIMQYILIARVNLRWGVNSRAIHPRNRYERVQLSVQLRLIRR